MSTISGPDSVNSTLQDLGFAADLPDKFDAGVRSGLLRDLHGVVVARHGRIVLERYFDGEDNAWGRPLGRIAFGPETLHDLRSVTKSIVGLTYGIALDRGLVPLPSAPLLAQFPEYPDLQADPERAKLRIEHALSMTLGTAWNEQIPYSDPANSEIMMEHAADKIRFVLDRPIVTPPGMTWCYNGGCTALLGHLIARGTGRSLPEFTREVLFAPLGITNFEWARGADGVASAASGLRLTPRDLTRIGAMVLAGGEMDGQRIVSAEWLASSLRPSIPTGDGLEYGWTWFLGSAPVGAEPAPRPWVAGFGNGGQRLFLMPCLGICLVTMSGAYNRMDSWITPTRLWREIVLANVTVA